MRPPGLPTLLLAVVFATIGCSSDDPTRWAADVEAFEAADRVEAPRAGGIVFVGSSSMRLWDLDKYFPDLADSPSTPLIKRALGGSQMSDSVYYADRIILPYRPQTLVVYAGDNDIAGRKSPARVRDDFTRLVVIVHAELPHTKIVYISIKPSIARWDIVGRMREANRLIREVTFSDDRLEYVDIDGPMIGADGKPQSHLFIEDGLHLSDAGYRLWADLLRPFLSTSALASR